MEQATFARFIARAKLRASFEAAHPTRALYRGRAWDAPLLCQAMTLPQDFWDDDVDVYDFVTRLGDCGCRTADDDGFTALHLLMSYQQPAPPKLLPFLTAAGCDPNAHAGYPAKTALDWAIRYQRPLTADLLRAFCRIGSHFPIDLTDLYCSHTQNPDMECLHCMLQAGCRPISNEEIRLRYRLWYERKLSSECEASDIIAMDWSR